METWLVADRATLAEYFGNGFATGQLPTGHLEEVPKTQIYDALHRAAKKCKTKTPYGKGAHSFDILAQVNPSLVAASSPWAKRFIDRMRERTRER